jgi:hypothetical protein
VLYHSDLLRFLRLDVPEPEKVFPGAGDPTPGFQEAFAILTSAEPPADAVDAPAPALKAVVNAIDSASVGGLSLGEIVQWPGVAEDLVAALTEGIPAVGSAMDLVRLGVRAALASGQIVRVPGHFGPRFVRTSNCYEWLVQTEDKHRRQVALSWLKLDGNIHRHILNMCLRSFVTLVHTEPGIRLGRVHQRMAYLSFAEVILLARALLAAGVVRAEVKTRVQDATPTQPEEWRSEAGSSAAAAYDDADWDLDGPRQVFLQPTDRCVMLYRAFESFLRGVQDPGEALKSPKSPGGAFRVPAEAGGQGRGMGLESDEEDEEDMDEDDGEEEEHDEDEDRDDADEEEQMLDVIFL